MIVFMRYSEAFFRPFSDWRKLLIGIVVFSAIDFFVYLHIYLVFVGVIIALVGYGYIYDAASYTLKKDLKLPEWKDFQRLFKQGILLVLTFLLYMLPAIIVLLNSGIGQKLIDPLVAIGGILVLLGFYLFPLAIFNQMIHKEFGKIVDFRFILQRAISGAYLSAFILVIIYSSIVQWIAVQANLYVTLWVFKALIWGTAAYLIGLTNVTLFAIGYSKIKK